MEYLFSLEDRVRDYECDLQGIVNHANYLHYFEHTRHQFLATLKINVKELHEQGIDPVIARINLALKTPLTSGDSYLSRLSLSKEGVRYVFHQDLFRKEDMRLVARADIHAVCLINGKFGPSELFDRAFAPFIN